MVVSGSILGGKYRVGRRLGKGGMGEVVEAMHIELGSLVAIKILRDDFAQQGHLVERFLREARAAAQLRGDHICRVQDYGTLDSGAPYMVMEMLEGRDLAMVLKQNGPLRPDILCSYMVQACNGISEPHALGMVHRDLKPANLFIMRKPDGTAMLKILDFGIAKFSAQIDVSMTETSAVVGSPAYMSPEQLRSSKFVDTRTDIWALGIVMYELVTGDQPFDGESPTALALAISQDPLQPLPADVPAGLAEVIGRCLKKDPNERYQDVGALAVALAPLATTDAAELASSATRVLAGTHTAELVLTTPTPPNDTTLRGATGTIEGEVARPRWYLGAAIATAAIAAITLVVVMRGRSEDLPDPTSHVSVVPATSPTHLPPVDAGVDAAPPIDAAPAPVPKHPKPVRHDVPPDLGRSRY